MRSRRSSSDLGVISGQLRSSPSTETGTTPSTSNLPSSTPPSPLQNSRLSVGHSPWACDALSLIRLTLKYQLAVEERNLLSVAYKNVIGGRASWRIIALHRSHRNLLPKKICLFAAAARSRTDHPTTSGFSGEEGSGEPSSAVVFPGEGSGGRHSSPSRGFATASTSRAPYCLLSLQDVSPIVSARARFLQLILDHFISGHVVELPTSEAALFATYDGAQSDLLQELVDTMKAWKPGKVWYEGDPRLVLPSMYVANMYQTLVNDANIRLSSLSGFRGKTIGVALETHGGLYRCLAKKFPPQSQDGRFLCHPPEGSRVFRRSELATSVETHKRFPELVLPEDKQVRFVVVNGLDIVEKPTNMPTDDAEWFKRLTGRDEVAVYARDYKFYSSRAKNRRVARANRRVASNSSPNSIPSSPPQNQQTTPHQSINESPHAVHYSQNDQCGATSHLPETSPTVSQHVVCSQPLTGGHVGGRLHVLPSTPAKFCDECGAPYSRETSKFCSECGVKRLRV